MLNLSLRFLAFPPKPLITGGYKKAKGFHETLKAARAASLRARKLEEDRGMFLSAQKQFKMELKRNTGIGWYRSKQICKFLEMHERGPGPQIDSAIREKITRLADILKQGK